jgi:hypothetical protein
MKFRPVKELEQQVKPRDILCEEGKSFEIPLNGRASVLNFMWKKNSGCTTIIAGGLSACVNFDTGIFTIENKKRSEEPVVISFEKEKEFSLKTIIDCGILEFFGNGGTIYAAMEAEEEVLQKPVRIEENV